jgi:hypothetical protein
MIIPSKIPCLIATGIAVGCGLLWYWNFAENYDEEIQVTHACREGSNCGC